ncbi:MAG: hypothetical protein WC169_05490 [Dehalococcoidia bacterium]|jgi:hypothetical protein
MARILFNDVWYEAISSSSLYEDEFEQIVLGRAHILYPGYFAVPFKKLVQSDTDSTIPDMALIDLQYRIWWIIEVEMAHHSLQQHIIPQVQTLSKAKYGEEEADFLAAKNTLLDRHRLLDMVKGVQPRVLIIVNSSIPGWKEALSKYDALLQIVEVFRSETNHHIVRVNGENPTTVEENLVSICHADRNMPRLLVVSSPAGLDISAGQKCEIEYEGGITEWERIDAKTSVWLSPLKRSPLNSSDDYRIVRDETGALHFKTVRKRRI